MACQVKTNSINYLEKEGAIDNKKRILNEELFDELNDKMTSLAEMKYGLQSAGEKLFSSRLSTIVANDILFENFQEQFNARQIKSINVSQDTMSSTEFMSEDDIRKIMSFDEVESVSNLIMNKLSIKERPYRMRNRKDIKEGLWYRDDNSVIYQVATDLISNIFGNDVVTAANIELGYNSSFEDIISSITKATNIPSVVANEIKILESNDHYLNEAIENVGKEIEDLQYEFNVVNGFIKYKDKAKIKEYSKKNQRILRKYFESLYKDNNFKSDAQAISFLGAEVKRKLKENIKNNKGKVFMYKNVQKAKIKKLKTLSNFMKIVPNWKDLIVNKINTEVTRMMDFKQYELAKNPNIERTLLARKLYQAAMFVSQESEFDRSNVTLTEAKEKIKKIFNGYDSSLYIPATTDTVTVLNNIINLKDSKYSELAKRLLPFAEKHNVPVSVLSPKAKDSGKEASAGYYTAKVGQLKGLNKSYIKGDYIHLDGNSKRFKVDPERLVLHEIVHSLTTIALQAETYRLKENFDKKTKRTREYTGPYDKFLKYLEDEVTKLRDVPLMRSGISRLFGPYGFTNIDELAAEALTNFEFQELLKQIPPMESKEFKNLFEQLLDFIGRLLNIDSYANALEQLEDVVQATMSLQNDFALTLDEALKETDSWLKDIKKGNINVDQKTLAEQKMISALPVVNINVQDLNRQRSEQLAEVLSERLAVGMNVQYENISPEKATDILKNRSIKYNGEPAFYYAGTVYLVGKNINPGTVLHEFSHPILQALRLKNNILFQKLYKDLLGTEEGQGIKYFVITNHPDLNENTDHFKEEVLAYAMQFEAVNKLNNKIQTEGFNNFMSRMIAAIKQILKKIFGSKVKVSKLNVDTSIEELADMLLEKELELDIPANLTEEDLVMFSKEVLDRAEQLQKNSNSESLQKLVELMYEPSRMVLSEVENFKSDPATYKMLKETLFQKGTKRYIRDVVSGLKDYLNTNVEELTEDELIQNALDGLKEQLDADLQKAIALVNNLDTINSMIKNMLTDIAKIDKQNINSRSTVALLMLYRSNVKAWLSMVEEIDQALSLDGELVDSSNPFYQTLNEIVQNITRVNTNIANLLKNNNVQGFIEMTGMMSEYVQNRLKGNLTTALRKTYPPSQLEEAVNKLYYKVTMQTLEDKDIDALVKAGVPKKVLEGFLQEYKDLVINEDKIKEALEGGAHDITWFNRWLESYSSSNDVIVGPLAMFIQNEKTAAKNEVWNESMKFRKKLEQLLPNVGFSKLNSIAMREKVGFLDTVFWVDKETGQPVKKKVWAYHGPFKNYRYQYDLLDYNLEEAKKTEDVDKIATAQFEFDQFKKDYMWQDFVPEFYEKDEIFKTSKVGKLAYYVRKKKLQAFNNLQNRMRNELERFENYSAIQAAFREFQQLYSLTYEDGTSKVDDEANGIYDLSIAELLIEHRNSTKDFYEWRAMDGYLQSAYNEFVDLLATKEIFPKTKDFDDEMKKWERQNLRMEIDPKYYEARSALFDELAQIQGAVESDYDISAAYKQISDLIYTYKDSLGEPDSGAMGKERLKLIRQLEQEISNYQQEFDNSTGLSRDNAEELADLSRKAANGELTPESAESKRYFYLLELQEDSGISSEDAARMREIFSELGSMTEKLPTIYYMDALNYNLSKNNIQEVEIDELDEIINSDEFQELLEEDEAFKSWFDLNHYVGVKWDDTAKKVVDVYKRTRANTVAVPINDDFVKYTEIENNKGEKVLLRGVPNARHSRYEVKDEYRTIPFGAKKSDYVGKYIDNKNQFLPRPFNPGEKHSAKNGDFINKEYFQMKAANSAEYKVLEAIKEYHLKIQEGTSNYSKLYLDMPRYAVKKGDVWQALQKNTYGQRFSELGKSIKEWYKQALGRSVMDAELDLNYDANNNLVNTDLDGRQISYVPVSGIYNIDEDLTSADIFETLIRYSISIKTQSRLLESLPLANSILATLEDPANAPKNLEKFDKGIFDLKGQLKKAKKKYATNNRLGQVKSLIEREYFGRVVEGIEETHPQFGKWINSLQGLSAMGALALNIPSDLKNKYGAYVQVIIEGMGSEFITLKDFALARPWAEKAMLEWSTKGIYATGPGSVSTQLIQIFDPTFRYKDEMGREIERSMIKDLANLEWMYMHRKFGEMQVAMALFGSFMFGQKVDQVLSDGTVKSLRYSEAWEKDQDGIIRLKPGIHPGWSNLPLYHIYEKGESLKEIAKKYSLPYEELLAKNRIKSEVQLEDGQEIVISKAEKFMMLKNRIQGTSRKLFGTYDEMGQAEGNKLLLYRMFFFMRKWFTPLFMNRFGFDSKTLTWTRGGERYDWATTSYGKGFYITAFQAMLKSMKSGFRDVSYLSNEEQIAVRKMAGEGLFVIGLTLLGMMLFGFDPEDDDKWNKLRAKSSQDNFNTYGFLSNHMLLLLFGVQAESSAFVPLPSVKGINFGADDYVKMITQTTSAWYNTVVLYIDILGDILDFITFSEMDRYKKDAGPQSWKQKGELKIWNKLRKTIGRTGGTDNPEEVFKNMIKNQSRLGG